MAILHEADRRLFHAIVLMGAGLTGGTLACGGAVAPSTVDSGAKSDSGYGTIHPDSGYGNIGIDSGYGNIGIDSGYGNISYPTIDSGYGNIGIDAADAGYGNIGIDAADAGDADAYAMIAPNLPDAEADGYPIIK
jgi:hypothetical protein